MTSHLLLFITIMTTFGFIIVMLARVLRVLQSVLIACQVSIGHAKLANEAAIDNGAKLLTVEAATIHAVNKAKDDLIEKAAKVHSPLPKD